MLALPSRKRFHFGSGEHQTRFERVDDLVVEARLAVLCDDLSVLGFVLSFLGAMIRPPRPLGQALNPATRPWPVLPWSAASAPHS
jgi:hypothetical protein